MGFFVSVWYAGKKTNQTKLTTKTQRKGSRGEITIEAAILTQSLCPQSMLWQPPDIHPGLNLPPTPAFWTLTATILPPQTPPTPHQLLFWARAHSQNRLKWNAVWKHLPLQKLLFLFRIVKPPECKLRVSKTLMDKTLTEKDVLGKVGVNSCYVNRAADVFIECIGWKGYVINEN